METQSDFDAEVSDFNTLFGQSLDFAFFDFSSGLEDDSRAQLAPATDTNSFRLNECPSDAFSSANCSPSTTSGNRRDEPIPNPFIETIDAGSKKGKLDQRLEIPMHDSICAATQQIEHPKHQPRIPTRAKQFLEERFAINAYPTAIEIEELATATEQTAARIKNWFGNARLRKEPPCNDVGDILGKPSIRPKLSQESLEKLSKEVEPDPRAALHAYLASSTEDELASMSAIQDAIRQEQNNDNSFAQTDLYSDAEMSQSRSSAPSLYSASSHASYSSIGSRTRRRGRKRFSERAKPYPGPETKFFCTFCWKGFKNRYSWSRHEESVHVVQIQWICCSRDHEGIDECIFCGHSNPDNEHLRSHNYLSCKSRSPENRTFDRKDLLFQHLKRFHHIQSRDRQLQLASLWVRKLPLLGAANPALRCAFCKRQFQSWKARCDHVIEHFEDGDYVRNLIAIPSKKF